MSLTNFTAGSLIQNLDSNTLYLVRGWDEDCDMRYMTKTSKNYNSARNVDEMNVVKIKDLTKQEIINFLAGTITYKDVSHQRLTDIAISIMTNEDYYNTLESACDAIGTTIENVLD